MENRYQTQDEDKTSQRVKKKNCESCSFWDIHFPKWRAKGWLQLVGIPIWVVKLLKLLSKIVEIPIFCWAKLFSCWNTYLSGNTPKIPFLYVEIEMAASDITGGYLQHGWFPKQTCFLMIWVCRARFLIFSGFVVWCGLGFKSQRKGSLGLISWKHGKSRERNNVQDGRPYSAAFCSGNVVMSNDCIYREYDMKSYMIPLS